MPDDRNNLENNDSSSPSSTCGENSISSNSVHSTASPHSQGERNTVTSNKNDIRSSGCDRTDEYAESSSTANADSTRVATIHSSNNADGSSNLSDASPASFPEDEGGSTHATAGSTPPGATTPEAFSPNTISGDSGSPLDAVAKIAARIAANKMIKDCHEIVKTSAIAGERRGNLCTVHQNGIRKTKVSVACQTDSDESIFPKISSQCSRASTTQPTPLKNALTSGATTASAETSMASSSTASDGTLRLMIQNFKNMGDTVRGPVKKIQAVPWRIMVMPRQHVVQKKGTQKCLGFFLQCCPDAYSDSWSCQASAELRLISQKQGVPHFTRKTNHVYTAKENDWGYSCFMTWADILDESQGYIKEDKVVLEVSVKAESPKNILTHDQFEKKIQEYMRLADIQSNRGLIDKAIEVNLSALKFCKDRDQDCKAELEAQKAKLIEMKLKQSIERIEKGPPIGKSDEENCLNQNALKQAISGTPATLKQPNVNKSASKVTSNGKWKDINNAEKNGSQQTGPQIPPALPKTAVEVVPTLEAAVLEKRTGTQTDKTVSIVPGITTTCKGGSGYSKSSTATKAAKESQNSTDFSTELLANSPYRAPWVAASRNPVEDGEQNLVRSFDFARQLEESMNNDVDRLTIRLDGRDEQNKIAVERNSFIMSKQNELIRSRAMKENISCISVRSNNQIMSEIKKMAIDAYEDELRRQSLKRLATKSFCDAQMQQKVNGLPNTCEMENDLLELGKLTEDPETVKTEQLRMNIIDDRSKKILHKQLEIEKMRMELGNSQQRGQPLWRSQNYKADMTGQKQPWTLLCDDSNHSERLLDYSSEEDTYSSAAETSDSEVEGSGSRTALGVPLSKKMKRSLEDRDVILTVSRDDCDSCIQALLEPTLPTQETSCQTDLCGKLEDSEWKKKKANDRQQFELPPKKNCDEIRPSSVDLVEKIEVASELTKEGITQITDLTNADAKIFQALPPIYHPSPQIFGEELAASQLQPYLDDGSQPNVWSRQYIEEWLKFNIKYCWKYMKNGENSPASGDESGIDLTSANIPHFNDAQVQQVMAALSVIGVNCVNAKRVVDKAAEFINTLESRSKSPFLKDCLQKLAVLAGDEKAFEPSKENRKLSDKDSSVECSVAENRLATEPTDENDDLSAIMSSMECPDDQHDYMLNREVHRIGVFADQAVSKNPLMEVGQAEKLNEHTEKISLRIATLECDKENLTKQLSSEREKSKKMEQKHTNSLKQAQSQLQSEKEKHEKTMQQLNLKRNELKKLDKALKQHERDIEKSKELQEKVDFLTKEMQEIRQKHAEELRKLQRELQSSQDTRKNMQEEIKARDSEMVDLRNQLNEKSLSLKRSESALCSERRSFQSSLSSMTERAKKGEIMYLEHRLETGIAVLERAFKDAGQRVKDLEAEQKKPSSLHPLEYLKTAIAEWKAKREEVASLIASSKAEFTAQIDQIRSGKCLSQLPKISVAKPPPAPKSFKMGQFAAAPSVLPEKQPTSSAIGVIGQIGRPNATQAGAIGTPISPNSVAPGSPVQSISKAPAPPSTVSPMKSPVSQSSTIAPIGVRPSSHINGSVDFSNNSTTLVSSVIPNVPSTSNASSGISVTAPWGSSWEGSLAMNSMNSINELMNPSRSFGPIGTDYGLGSAAGSSQLSQPPPGLNTSAGHFSSAQSNGWGNTAADWSTSISGQHGHYNQIPQSAGYQSAQWAGSSWAGYHTSQSGASPDVSNPLLDGSRSSSPRRDVLLESLRTNFPQVPNENLKEHINEFMNRNNCSNLKGISVNDVVHGVAQVINSKQMWNKSAIPPLMHQPPPNVIVPPVAIAGVDPYQSPSRLHAQQANVHSHVLMQQQLRDGMDGTN